MRVHLFMLTQNVRGKGGIEVIQWGGILKQLADIKDSDRFN
jgi:hypothetical protein